MFPIWRFLAFFLFLPFQTLIALCRATKFDHGAMTWMHKPLGKLFMSLYEAQTFAKGVKRCRRLAGLPEQRFQDGTPVYNLRFVPTATTISSSLLAPPRDWPLWQQVTGFLMMDGGREDVWSAPDEFLAFLARGKTSSSNSGSSSGSSGSSGSSSTHDNDDQKPVYVGFGSMCGDEAMAVHLTRTALASLRAAKQRGVLLGGWAGMTRHRLDPVADAVRKLTRMTVDENVFLHMFPIDDLSMI